MFYSFKTRTNLPQFVSYAYPAVNPLILRTLNLILTVGIGVGKSMLYLFFAGRVVSYLLSNVVFHGTPKISKTALDAGLTKHLRLGGTRTALIRFLADAFLL